MSDEIDVMTFRRLVELAALEMDEGEAEYLRTELNKQLDAIRELEAIPLDSKMVITSHGTKYTTQISPKLRGDDWAPFERAKAILKEAPQINADHFVVPDVPHKILK